MFECPEFGLDLQWTYANAAIDMSIARVKLKQCMLRLLEPRERPTTYVSTTTSLQTFMNQNVGVLLPASKAGCTYVRDGWTINTLRNCYISDDTYVSYGLDIGKHICNDTSYQSMHSLIERYWTTNTSVRCCLTLSRAMRIRSRLESGYRCWLNENQVQAYFHLDESIGLFCRSNCGLWAPLLKELFHEATGRKLHVEQF